MNDRKFTHFAFDIPNVKECMSWLYQLTWVILIELSVINLQSFPDKYQLSDPCA